ncbi:DUF4307 domain-containing protein [Mycobacterium sp. M1]|uniref:DUF4307 domain-containing protein n=1 Tax=Mycolicibacter acidiphilus TaxID=2835306 RepID=A0ABS5RK40_9MYCO|nr:DUF4307 domain-containing protein [Mycolicibacter acidiphilus]MBS9534661.1 DUF4307 domain-containing protein [Mycolicibacter acidiphilus]
MTDPTPARYGNTGLRATPRRLVAIALAALAVATITGLAILGYHRLSGADVKGELFGYQVIDDQTVSVKITVTRSDPSQPVVCIVRVRAVDGSETGRREVLVPPSDSATVQVTTTVKSSQRPMMGDVYGCGTDVPGYLRSP